MTQPTFSPYTVALVTPFDANGGLSEAPVRALIALLKSEGVPAFLVSGSTGEQHSMTVDERASLYRWAVAEAGSAPVYAGVAAVRTDDAIALAGAAEAAGTAGIMLGFPPYVRLGNLDARAYARRVCASTSLPVLIYNNPLRTAFDLVPEILEALASENPTVRAVKETGDATRAAGIKRALGRDFQVFSGHDRMIANAWAQGYDGLTSIAGNLWPRQMATVVTALVEGRPLEAEALLATLAPFLSAVVEPQLPSTLKHALRFVGRPGGFCREPLGHLGSELERSVEATVTSLRPLSKS